MESGRQQILVAEQSGMMLNLLQRILEKQGYLTLPAQDGREAYRLFRLHSQKIDGVLADLHMPEMNGVELHNRIRQDNPEVPVIVLSAYEDDELLGEISESGFTVVVLKPFEVGEFLEVISVVLAPALIP